MIFLIILAGIWLLAATIHDIRKKEVPNWISFSLIIFAFVYRGMISVFSLNYWPLIYGLIGFGIFFILANVFYYSRIFAGGDAKLLMALGAVLPFSLLLEQNLQIMATFIIFLLGVGGVYGLIFSFYLVAKNKKKFSKEFKVELKRRKKLFIISFVFALFSIILLLTTGLYLLFLFPLIFLLYPLLFVYARAVENAGMIVEVSAKEVVIGDWLYEDVKIGRRRIKTDWRGLSAAEVKLLRKSRKKVKIKQGMAFVPVFFIAYVLLIMGFLLELFPIFSLF